MNDFFTIPELRTKLAEAGTLVEIGALYEHYKGARYRVRDIVLLEAGREPAALYHPEDEPDVSFVRPLASFLETVGDTPRFKKL